MYINKKESEYCINLINRAKDVIQKTPSNNLQDNFNIFSLLNMESNEAHMHTVFLYELLRINGHHNKGNLFLKSFLESVIGIEYDNNDIYEVYREYDIKQRNNYGHIDLVIKSSNCIIPIEIKIYAREQKDQINRYYKWALSQKNKNQCVKVVFLTLDGREPTTSDCVPTNQLHIISYRTDIHDWLCEIVKNFENQSPLQYAIHQYIDVLEKLTDTANRERSEKMKDIFLSKEDYCAAKAISETLIKKQGLLLKQVFDNIKKYMENNTKKSLQCNDDEYIEKSKKYYAHEKGGAFPGIAFILDSNDEYCLSIRFEIDHNLFYGLAVYKKDENGCYNIRVKTENTNTEEMAKKISMKNFDTSEWYYKWKYFYVDGKKINFKKCDDDYFNLFDKNGYNHVIESVYREIEDFLRENQLYR